jgi:hypothetical protein
MVITWEDALEARYTKGRDEGALQTARRAIVLLARHRHRQLPAGFEKKLEAIADLSRLYEILEQMEDVRGLEELDLTP